MVSHNLRQPHLLEVDLTKILGDHETLSLVRHVGLRVKVFIHEKSSLDLWAFTYMCEVKFGLSPPFRPMRTLRLQWSQSRVWSGPYSHQSQHPPGHPSCGHSHMFENATFETEITRPRKKQAILAVTLWACSVLGALEGEMITSTKSTQTTPLNCFVYISPSNSPALHHWS